MNVYKDISNYNKKRKNRVLLVFDDMIADIEYNKKFKKIIKELFYRGRKMNISNVFITQCYFRALKDARLNSTHYILMKIGNEKEIRSIAEEKSRNIDYKDFLKMYNYCTHKPYSFMTIDARPNAAKVFQKTLQNFLIKMTKKEQIKILSNKILANRAQYMLDRKNPEVSAKSSGELDKYEYLTGEDLGYKPDSVEKAKFEYSPSGKVFTEVFKNEEGRKIKNVGLLKSLQNIHDVNKKQLEFFNNFCWPSCYKGQ